MKFCAVPAWLCPETSVCLVKCKNSYPVDCHWAELWVLLSWNHAVEPVLLKQVHIVLFIHPLKEPHPLKTLSWFRNYTDWLSFPPLSLMHLTVDFLRGCNLFSATETICISKAVSPGAITLRLQIYPSTTATKTLNNSSRWWKIWSKTFFPLTSGLLNEFSAHTPPVVRLFLYWQKDVIVVIHMLMFDFSCLCCKYDASLSLIYNIFILAMSDFAFYVLHGLKLPPVFIFNCNTPNTITANHYYNILSFISYIETYFWYFLLFWKSL